MYYPEKIQRKIVDSDKTIIQTMKLMDEGFTKLLLVFEGERFLGIITNGDIQRAIMAKVPFDAPIGNIVTQKGKVYAHLNDDRESVKEWMLANRAELMPVVDDNGQLIDVIFWSEVLEGAPNNILRPPINIPVVIMAGGQGLRLRPFTNIFPKPLVPFGDKTIMEVILDQFESIGCHEFYMSVNYKADMIKYYLSQLEHQYDIEFLKEEKPLGTIGGVALLKGKINSPFFVSNCDSISEQDYRDVYEYHVNNRNDITIVTVVKDFQIPYGVIETGEDGLMIALREKPDKSYQMNTGVYIMNPTIIDEIPIGEFYHVTQLIEKVRQKDGRIGCFPISEKSWRDIGDWKEYLRMIDAL